MLYGPWVGAAVILVGCMISSAFIFVLVHKLGAPFVQSMVPTNYLEKFRRFEKTGKLNIIVFVLFLIPGLPKDVFTYLVPLTDMNMRTFLLLSNVGRIPGIIVSTYAADGLMAVSYTHLAERVVKMRSSAVRDLFSAASNPNIISLSGGMPDVSLLPHTAIRKAARAACDDERAVALQYGSTDGRVETKRVFCDLMRDIGVRVKPENVMITTGAQEALDLIAKTFVDPGDIVLAEGPTYLGLSLIHI